MTLHPRALELADLAAAARLHADCFPGEGWDARALAEILAMPGASGRLIAASNGDLHGLLLDLILGEEAEILTLGVIPAARRQGVARALVEDLLARCRKAGAKSVLLEVAIDNPAAYGLYESCGFAAVGRRPRYYKRGGNAPVDAWLLRRTVLG